MACSTRLPTINQLLSIYGVHAKKNLSQNFLLHEPTLSTFQRPDPFIFSNRFIIEKIVGYLQRPLDENLVIEIGPGPGGLTRELLKLNPKRLIVVEKDLRFKPFLKQLEDAYPGKLTLHFEDAKNIGDLLLPVDLENTVFPLKRVQVIGNLPFGVASIIHLKLLQLISSPSNSPIGKLFSACPNVEFLFMFQKEVAERIVAKYGKHDRSRLSVITQHYCETELCMLLPGKSFVPCPSVDAAVIRMIKKPSHTIPFNHLTTLVQAAFKYPRKMLISNLRSAGLLLLDEDLPATIPSGSRASNLSDIQFIDIYHKIKHRIDSIN